MICTKIILVKKLDVIYKYENITLQFSVTSFQKLKGKVKKLKQLHFFPQIDISISTSIEIGNKFHFIPFLKKCILN